MCLVYRKSTKSYGTDDKTQTSFNNLYDAGYINDLILTFRPNKFFSVDDNKDGQFTNTFISKNMYCVKAFAARTTD